MNRKIRIAAWVVIVAIAAFQAYAQRYTAGPDGISYLDLSDAVVAGHWSGLLNLYWSPLYPALIGVLRAAFGAGPAREVPLEHLASFLAFVATFGAFEYFLIAVLEMARRVRGVALRGSGGVAAAYAVFGLVTLIMTPLALTTPDLLAAACVLAALGAMLRLREGNAHADRRTAVICGLALGVGALAKSFLVPWAVVCIVTLAVATRRRGTMPTVVTALVWAVIAVPWCAALSRSAGRFTFGDTGRLTYIWYVNNEDAPSAGGVPPGARTASTDAILPGVGVVGDAPGTDPMWLDPARWNAPLRPRWSIEDEWETLKVFEIFYVEQFAPLLFLISLIFVAPARSRRRVWLLGWVVFVPSAIGLGAYALVIVTARYIMPFVLATVLLLLATVPIARRLRPNLALVGLLIPVGLETIDPHTLVGLGLVASAIGALLAGVLVPARSRVVWVLSVVLAALVTHVVVVPLGLHGAAMATAVLVVAYWLLARQAVRQWRGVSFARRSEVAVAIIVVLMFALRFQNRTSDDLTALAHARSPSWGNAYVSIAQMLATHGVGPGTRIAVIGPHAEAYWARAGRLHIAADVPRPIVGRFWSLPLAAQDSLLAEFARAGATYAIVSVPPTIDGPRDPRWQQFRFDGWLRRLTP